MLDAKNLSYSVGDVDIIEDISISVEKSSITGIIGPNGSGKSTFLKNVYKVLKPRSGSVSVEGQDIIKMSNKKSASILSVLSQENSTAFDFTVLEVVLMSRYHTKKLVDNIDDEDIEICKKALKKVDLEDLSDRKFNSLSGGEKQRVLLARALAQDTNIIILDEPTNHLDIGSKIKILKLVKNSQKTVLTAIHDLDIAIKFCDYIYALKDGKIYAQGLSQEIITPKLVKDLYGVDCEIFSRNGELFIQYMEY